MKKYGCSEKRRYLIGLLNDELVAIKEKGWSFRAYIFGSMVNSETENPNDVDCLLSIHNPMMDGIWEPGNCSNELHFWPSFIRFDPELFYSTCRELPEMIEKFNRLCIKTDENIQISLKECVEI